MRSLTLGVWIASMLLFSSEMLACSVPVFRYALERWQSDDFKVAAIYRGELSPEQQRLAARLTESASANVSNVKLSMINLDELSDGESNEVGSELPAGSLPHMLVYSPAQYSERVEVMSLPLTAENVDILLDSPVRQEITSRLLQGHSAVWVLLESGDQSADTAAAQMLESELSRLQSELTLPEIDPADIHTENLTVDPATLRLEFSVMRLSRTDRREGALIEMLLSTESDLRDEQFVGQPMAFPVFGRGRVLYALIGRGINPDTIADACEFIAGPCQCTVKAQNPGVDLLTSIDWEAHVVPSLDREEKAPPLVGLSQFAAANATVDDEAKEAVEADATVADEQHSSSLAEARVSTAQKAVAAGQQSAIADELQSPSASPATAGIGTIVAYALGGLILLVAGLSVMLMRRPH